MLYNGEMVLLQSSEVIIKDGEIDDVAGLKSHAFAGEDVAGW
jgi:hypothetical protein